VRFCHSNLDLIVVQTGHAHNYKHREALAFAV
jgi:hypothetical protein